jgi:hypothetical protein
VSEEERQPPRFQDTSERAALPVPLPGSEEPAPVEDPPEPSADGSDSTTDETAAVPPAEEPEAPSVDPLFAPPAAEAVGAPSAPGGDAHPEIMVGAAFLGGVGLALLIKRLGS